MYWLRVLGVIAIVVAGVLVYFFVIRGMLGG